MKVRTYRIANVALASAGVLFSGYLSGKKFFTSNCAFDEPCPLFLGYPTCYFGFALFSAMLVIAILALAQILADRTSRYALRLVSLSGMLFAGYFVAAEINRYRTT